MVLVNPNYNYRHYVSVSNLFDLQIALTNKQKNENKQETLQFTTFRYQNIFRRFTRRISVCTYLFD